MPLTRKSKRTVVNSVTVQTDLFEHRHVKPHFINPCCFGEDFAAWLRENLSKEPDLAMELSQPIQEDYGWGLWASRRKDRFWIALSYVGDGPQEGPVRWIVSVTYDPGFNPVRLLFHKPDRQALEELWARIRRVLASSSAIRTLG